MSKNNYIVVAHSDNNALALVCRVLKKCGFRASPINSLTENKLKQHVKSLSTQPNLILLCNFYKGAVKTSVIKGLRKNLNIPILLLSNSKDETDIINALDAGASDYLISPFGTAELIARIRVALRDATAKRQKDDSFEHNGLLVQFSTRDVMLRGTKVSLTPIEYRILVLLIANKGTILTYPQIITDIWGPDKGGTLILRVNVANLRKKIETDPTYPSYILTESGIGYKFNFE